CGSMFGLAVRRHRWFESSAPLSPFTPSCNHSAPITGVYGHPHGRGGAWRNGTKPMLPSDLVTWRREMGIDWMTAKEFSQAIPPAYTEWIGRHLLAVLSPPHPFGHPLGGLAPAPHDGPQVQSGRVEVGVAHQLAQGEGVDGRGGVRGGTAPAERVPGDRLGQPGPRQVVLQRGPRHLLV